MRSATRSACLDHHPRMPKLVVRWPKGPLAVFITLLFLATMLVAFVPSSRSLPVLQQTWQLSQAVFKTEGAFQKVMVAGVLAHVVESLYAALLCSRAGAGLQATLGWVGITWVIGYCALYDIKQQLQPKNQRPVAAAKRRA